MPKTITDEWVPVTGPRRCKCGHDHYGRQQRRNGVPTNLAPQWDICEDDTCDCIVLRPAGKESAK